jgi:threonine/homoserine/homoserine lactone efflux protein
VGPIGVLCIRRTLVEGRAVGLASGLGAACADALYGTVAGYGLAFIGDRLLSWQRWLRLLGGLYLLYLGIRTYLARPRERVTTGDAWEGIAGAYGSAFVLTLANPVTVLSFAGVLAGLGVAESDSRGVGVLVLGVFVGSAAWWLFLSTAVAHLGRRIDGIALRWINRASGIAVAGFGIYALAGVLRVA